MINTNDFFKLDFNFSDKKEKKKETEPKQRIRCSTERSRKIFENRRYKSEQELLKNTPWHYETGTIYNCISHGDVDSLTFLKNVLRQQKLEYLLLSTWCIGIEDVQELKTWIESGIIKRADFYLGEIAKASYAQAQADLERIAGKTGGRCGVFRNHAKVMCCYGNRFNCAILSSANVNTNPRTEQTVIFCDTNITNFYKEFFDDINPFNGSPDGWAPYKGAVKDGKERR